MFLILCFSCSLQPLYSYFEKMIQRIRKDRKILADNLFN